jgi:hypothetical protein
MMACTTQIQDSSVASWLAAGLRQQFDLPKVNNCLNYLCSCKVCKVVHLTRMAEQVACILPSRIGQVLLSTKGFDVLSMWARHLAEWAPLGISYAIENLYL